MPLVRNDIDTENFFNIFIKNSIIKDIVDYCCREKNLKEDSSIPRQKQMVYQRHQNLKT